jgi:hypothetical protein
MDMSITRVIALAATSLALAGCSSGDQSVAVTAPAGSSAMTVQIGTDGDPSVPTNVQYTCPGSGAAPVCGPEVVKGRWTKTLTVPVGMEVWIHATNAKDGSAKPPNCWISDEPGSKTYSKSDGGSCVLQVKEAPPA